MSAIVRVLYDASGNICQIAKSDDPAWLQSYKQPGLVPADLQRTVYDACTSHLDIHVAAQPLLAITSPQVAALVAAEITALRAQASPSPIDIQGAVLG